MDTVKPAAAAAPPSLGQQPIQILVDNNANSSRSKFRLWHIVIGIIALFYAARLVNNVHRRWKKYAQSIRCGKVTDRILILVYSYRDSAEASMTIMSLLRTASCPGRISFGVYQEFESRDDDSDVYNSCMGMCKDDDEQDMIERIRVVSMEDAAATTKGPLYGIRSAFRQTWKGEKYVLLVPCGIRALDGWDVAWTKNYTGAIETVIGHGAIAVTSEPEMLRQRPVKNTHPLQENGITAVAQNFIRNINETSRATIVAKPRSTFPVLGKMKGRFPIVSTRTFPQRNEDAVQTTMLGSCVLTSATSFKSAMRFADIDCPPYALSFMLSALMHTHARASFVAADPVFVRAATPRDMRPAQWSSKALQEKVIREYSDYCSFSGVDMEKSIVMGRGLMGLLPELDPGDILSKYGTRREFERVKMQFASK